MISKDQTKLWLSRLLLQKYPEKTETNLQNLFRKQCLICIAITVTEGLVFNYQKTKSYIDPYHSLSSIVL